MRKRTVKELPAAELKKLMKDERWLTCAEVARLIGVSRQAIHDRCDRRTLEVQRDLLNPRIKTVCVCDAVKVFHAGRPVIRPFDVKEISRVSDPSAFAVLFARSDSVYRTMGADVYDAERDALTFKGRKPVVAHPPCRSWGKVRGLAKPRPGEKELAPWAVNAVLRRCGGVLEHPKGSTLWAHCGLPFPGEFPDDFGGYTLEIDQFNFGHVARKATWLYIVGVHPRDLPPMPEPVKGMTAARSILGGVEGTKECTQYMREYTPPKLAAWLCEVAELAGKHWKQGKQLPESATVAPLPHRFPTAETSRDSCRP